MPRKYNKRDFLFWREKESRKEKNANKIAKVGTWIKENPLEATLTGVATAAAIRYGGKSGLKALKRKGAPVKDRIGGFFQDAAEAVGEDKRKLQRLGLIASGMSPKAADKKIIAMKEGGLSRKGKKTAKSRKGKKTAKSKKASLGNEENAGAIQGVNTSNTEKPEIDNSPKPTKAPQNQGDGVSHTPKEQPLETDPNTQAFPEKNEVGGVMNREDGKAPQKRTGSGISGPQNTDTKTELEQYLASQERKVVSEQTRKPPSLNEEKLENYKKNTGDINKDIQEEIDNTRNRTWDSYDKAIERLKKLSDPKRKVKKGTKKVNYQKRRKQLRRRLAAIEQSYATQQPTRYTRSKNYKTKELNTEAKKRFEKNALEILGWDKDSFSSDLLFLTDFRDMRSDKGKKRGKYKTRKKKYIVDPKEKDIGDMTNEEYRRSLAERRLKTKKLELPTKMFREVVAPVASLAREVRGIPRALLYLKELRGVKEPAKKTKELRQKLGVLRDVKGLAGM